ncbi:MAG: DNA methyltransferase [bacterium]|nr:DNA methyltransferase [bacterium]
MTNEIKKVKDDLIDEIDKRIADKIIEKTNADLLKKLITGAETINEAIMIAELGTTYKRTGFHFDKRLEKMTDTIKYFKKNEKLSFVQDKNALTHKLIIGDNYDALINLLIEYRGKIDVIYIDPPYGKDSMGEFAKTNYENAITRDNLLSMLYPRLVLARQLLSDNGVIFCSIDKRNDAYVRGLFDEIFEERNFAGVLCWKKKKQPSYLHGQIATVIEHILVYAKDINSMEKLSLTSPTDDNTRVDNATNIVSERVIKKGTRVKLENTISIIKSGVYKNKTMQTEYMQAVSIKNGRTLNDIRVKAKFRDSQERIDLFCKEDVLFITKNYGLRRDKLQEESEKRKAITDLLLDWGDNQDSEKEIMDIFGKKVFEYPKPTTLIYNLVKSVYGDQIIILDFFAGSGTMGQAVVELNKDGGKRQFILATANEITDTTPNGIVNDVTSKRLKRVMTGKCYDSTKDFKWNEKNKPLGDNLDVYDIATVAPYSDEPFTQIDETLYGKEKLGVNEKIQWVCENFEGTQKKLEEK